MRRVDAELDDWNPDDPQYESVFYDVSDWSIDQQSEVSAAFAEQDIRHAWRGFELAVPARLEAHADAVFEALERRLGLATAAAPVEPVDLDAREGTGTLVEYDLAGWSEGERHTLGTALDDAQLPHRWEGPLLLVPAEAEEFVDELLDAVESGDVMIMDDAAGDDEASVTLDELDSLSRSLVKEPRDERAAARLAEVVASIDPERPPFGVQLATWRRAVTLCREIELLLATQPLDEISVVERAEELEALVRPLV